MYKPKNFTPSQAKKYLSEHFKYETEIISYSHEITDNGVLNKEHIEYMDNETIVNVAEDLHYSFWCEFGYLFY